MSGSGILEISLIVLKAAAIGMLVRIAYVDFTTLKIRNDQVVALLAISLSIVVLDFWRTGDVSTALALLAAAALTFVVLFVFWMMRKLGAGDVKLFAIMPLLVGVNGSVTFVGTLLATTLLIYAGMQFPNLLPEPLFKAQFEALKRDRNIPFGVPIAIAAIVALLLPIGVSSLQRTTAPPPASELDLNDLQ